MATRRSTRSTQSKQTEPVLNDSSPTIRTLINTMRLPSFSKDSERSALPNPESETPLILSPTGTASTASTPDASSHVWDTPQSTHQLNAKSQDFVLTPLTPPTTCDRPAKRISIHAIEHVAATETLTTSNVKLSGEDDRCIEKSQDEDYFFKPKKLIRNLTKELQAIKDANTVAAQKNYNLEPSFDFLETSRSPSHSRSNGATIKTNHTPKNDDPNVCGKAKCNESIVDPDIIIRTSISSSSICKELEHIVPMTIQTRVKDKQGTCVASKVGKPSERCSFKGPSAKIDEISCQISRCNFRTDHVEFIELIEGLVRATMCGKHCTVAFFPKRQAKLKGWVSEFSHLSDKDRLGFQAWVTAISTYKLSSNVHTPSTTMQEKHDDFPISKTATTCSEAAVSRVLKNKIAKFPMPPPSNSPFVDFQAKWMRKLSVSNALHDVIIKPLKRTDEKDGFIYMFWEEGLFGKVKVGRTDDLTRRLNDWNRKCKRTHTYHPASQRGELTKIPHVSRIERLMHIELKEQRRERHCESCNQSHQEWFEVGEALVLQVFEKWREWILQKPYALDRQTKQWILRPEMMNTLEQVCKPTVVANEKKSTPHRGRKSTGSTKKGKRRTI